VAGLEIHACPDEWESAVEEPMADAAAFDFRSALLENLPHLRAFARSLTRDKDLADDLVHDAVVRALTAATQFTPGTNFRAWMFTILRNLFYNENKKWTSKVVSLGDDLARMKTNGSQEIQLEFADFRRAFWQLTADQREVLILVGAGGLSYEQAAEICNCRLGTIKSRISRARSDLRTILDSDKVVLRRSEMAIMSDERLFGPVPSIDDGTGRGERKRAPKVSQR
jgi:RNA polymerase sigma-70 factor (ECF subfamily)